MLSRWSLTFMRWLFLLGRWWVGGRSRSRAHTCSCVCLARVRKCERLTPHDRSNREGWATADRAEAHIIIHPVVTYIVRARLYVGARTHRTRTYISLSLATLSRWLMRKLRVSPFRDEAEHAVGKYRDPDRRSDSRLAARWFREKIGSGRLSVRRFCGTTRWDHLWNVSYTDYNSRVGI